MGQWGSGWSFLSLTERHFSPHQLSLQKILQGPQILWLALAWREQPRSLLQSTWEVSALRQTQIEIFCQFFAALSKIHCYIQSPSNTLGTAPSLPGAPGNLRASVFCLPTSQHSSQAALFLSKGQKSVTHF